MIWKDSNETPSKDGVGAGEEVDEEEAAEEEEEDDEEEGSVAREALPIDEDNVSVSQGFCIILQNMVRASSVLRRDSVFLEEVGGRRGKAATRAACLWR